VADDIRALAREGLQAWRRGDFETLEQLFDRDVTWGWLEPGEWDCKNRADVMRTLRERHEQGFARGEVEFREAGEDAIIVVTHPRELGGPEWPAETATLMSFRDGRVVSMRDYKTELDAQDAAGPK
jgi:ketosteroid isomerase-like protein